MSIDEAVKRAMKSKKLTQTWLSSEIGTGQSNISMWLKSGVGMRVENLLRIANACGFDLVLVDREDDGNRYMIGDASVAKAGNGPDGGDESFDDKVRKIVAEELAKRGTPGMEE